MDKEWKDFGWQHFRFSVPSNWDLVDENGHEEKGYCKFDDLENVKLEVRWEIYRGNKDFLLFITNYAKKIGWENCQIRSMFNSNHHYSIENNDAEIRQMVVFYHNPQASKRVIALRFFLMEEKFGLKRVIKIIKSIQEDFKREKSLWAFYDHHYELPTSYRKVTAALNSGHRKLTYAWRNKIVLCWSISLVKTFCPHKPFSVSAMNEWIPELIKTEFKTEISLPELPDFFNQVIEAKTSRKGRMLLKNIFHLEHNWIITAHYNRELDTLHLVIANYFTKKTLESLSPIKGLVKANV